ncbi:MAG: hypothetical protein ICCCNLDF_00092 [Planctomycetes bacterium]|nr:hypothetical protein [Planctomycetota bacterium]
MRLFKVLFSLLCLISIQTNVGAKGGVWKPVEFSGFAAGTAYLIDGGSRAYASVEAADGTSFRLFMLDKGKSVPVTSNGEDFRFDGSSAIVGNRLIGPKYVPVREGTDERNKPYGLFALDDAKAVQITHQGAPLVGYFTLVTAGARACPYFAVVGSHLNGLFRLEGSVATAIECPKFEGSLLIRWADGLLVLGIDGKVWVQSDDKFVELLDETGVQVAYQDGLQLSGTSLATVRTALPIEVFELKGKQARPITFDDGVRPLGLESFDGATLVCCESGGGVKALTGIIMEIKAGKPMPWKATAEIIGSGGRALTNCGKVALVSVMNPNDFRQYRVDAKGARLLEYPEGYTNTNFENTVCTGSTIVGGMSSIWGPNALGTVDLKGKVEVQLGVDGKPLLAGSIKVVALEGGVYAVGHATSYNNSKFSLVYRAMK